MRIYILPKERGREREKGFAFFIFNLFYGDKFVSFCFRVLFFFFFVYGGCCVLYRLLCVWWEMSESRVCEVYACSKYSVLLWSY